jgi:hypothetical protein
VYTGDDPLNAEDPLGLGAQANEALTVAISTLAQLIQVEKKHPSAANRAAVLALEKRVIADFITVNTENQAALKQATNSKSNLTQVPSQVAAAESNVQQAQACENRANGLFIAGPIFGLGLSYSASFIDVASVFSTVDPEIATIGLIFIGFGIVVVAIGAGAVQSSLC